MRPRILTLSIIACLLGSAAQGGDRGLLAPSPAVVAAARPLHESDDHIDLDGQDLDRVELTDEEWEQVANPHAKVYGQSDWPSRLPTDGPSEDAFARSFFGVWQNDVAGFSPQPLRTISDYHRVLHLRQDRRAALRLQVTERAADGDPSGRLLADQLQIARLYLKFSPEPARGPRGRPIVEGMYLIDYLEDYDCPCAFGVEPFEVTEATRVFASPPPSRTYFFRAFLDDADRLVISDVLKSADDRTSYLRVAEPGPGTAVRPMGWAVIKHLVRSPAAE